LPPAGYLVIVGGRAVVASRGLCGLVSGLFGCSLLPAGYRSAARMTEDKPRE
jgi:hypothetical protein